MTMTIEIKAQILAYITCILQDTPLKKRTQQPTPKADKEWADTKLSSGINMLTSQGIWTWFPMQIKSRTQSQNPELWTIIHRVDKTEWGESIRHFIMIGESRRKKLQKYKIQCLKEKYENRESLSNKWKYEKKKPKCHVVKKISTKQIRQGSSFWACYRGFKKKVISF